MKEDDIEKKEKIDSKLISYIKKINILLFIFVGIIQIIIIGFCTFVLLNDYIDHKMYYNYFREHTKININKDTVVSYVDGAIGVKDTALKVLRKKPIYKKITELKNGTENLEREMSVTIKGRYGVNFYEYRTDDIHFIRYGYKDYLKSQYLVLDKIHYIGGVKHFQFLDLVRTGTLRSEFIIDVRDCNNESKEKEKMAVIFEVSKETVPYYVYPKLKGRPWRVNRNKRKKIDRIYKGWRFNYEKEKIEEVEKPRSLECY